MTPIVCCGFECGVQGTVGQHWNNNSTQANFQTSTVRSGARAARFNPTAAKSIFLNNTISTGVTVYVMTVYVRFATLPNVTSHICCGSTATTTYGAMFQASDGKIYAGREATGTFTLAAAGVAVTTGQWYRIDVLIDTHTNPHTVDVKVDGVACTQATNAVAGANMTQYFVGTNVNTTCDWFADDFILSNTLGDYPIGQGYVNHFVPTGDISHNVAAAGDFQKTLTGTNITNATTDAYQLIDDIPLESGAGTDWINMVAPTNAGDYVQCRFGPAPGINTPKEGPKTIEVIIAIRQAGTGTGNMEARLRDGSGSSIIYTATTVAGTTTCIYKRVHVRTGSGSKPWTAGVAGTQFVDAWFNNVMIQFGSPAAVDANPDQYLVSAMIEAWFNPILAPPVNINQSINRSNTY